VTDVNYGGTQQDKSIPRGNVIIDFGIRGHGRGGNGFGLYLDVGVGFGDAGEELHRCSRV